MNRIEHINRLGSEIEKERQELERLKTRIRRWVTKQAQEDAANACFKNPTTIYATEELRAHELNFRRTEDALLDKVASLLR